MKRWLWTQVSDIGPSARFQHAMAYDEARDRVVLFGGRTKGPTPGTEIRPSDTWEWDGESWTQIEDVGPPGRSEFAMAYDSARNRVVLFGGLTTTLVNDTWEWDGHVWTQVEDSGPPPMAGHTMAYDKTHGYVLLYRDSTWAWNGAIWTQLTEVGPPTKLGVAAHDDAHGYVILGANHTWSGTPPQPKPSTTWQWDGASWKPTSDMGPSYSSPQACMAFDGKRLVLYQTSNRETWEWDGTYWIQRQDIGPSPRLNPAMVGDMARERCVLFGGTHTDVGDTWVLSVKEA